MSPFERHYKRLDALRKRLRLLSAGGVSTLAVAELLDDLNAQALAWRTDYEYFRSLSLPEFKTLVDLKQQMFDELAVIAANHERAAGSDG